jgi:hypothetical protein
LIRIAKAPQDLPQRSHALDAWVDAIAKMRRGGQLGVETRPRLLQMGQRGGELPQIIQRVAERLMGGQEQHRIAVPLGQALKVIAQIARGLQSASAAVKVPQPPHRGEQMEPGD